MQHISRKVNKQSVLVHILHGLYRRILLFVSTSLLVFGVWGLAFRVWHIYPKHRLDSSYKASRTSVGLRRLYTTSMLVCTSKYHASWYFVRYISGFNVPRLLILCGCLPSSRRKVCHTANIFCSLLRAAQIHGLEKRAHLESHAGLVGKPRMVAIIILLIGWKPMLLFKVKYFDGGWGNKLRSPLILKASR